MEGGQPAGPQDAAPKDVDFDSSIAWRGKSDEVCYLGDVHATIKVCSVRGLNTDTPTAHVLTPDDTVIHSFSFDAAGQKLVLNQTGMTYARDLFLSSSDKSTRLTTVNPQVDTWKLPQLSRVSWKGAPETRSRGSWSCTGLQAGHEAADGGPAARGPTASDSFGFKCSIYGHTLLAAQGYALFSPNYRGSTGYWRSSGRPDRARERNRS